MVSAVWPRNFITPQLWGVLCIMASIVLVARQRTQSFALQSKEGRASNPYQVLGSGDMASGVRYKPQTYDDGSDNISYKTLVIYVYYESDAVTKENLQFFLKAGVGDVEDPLTDYVIVVNGETTLDLGGLPPNVRIKYRDNTCYDGGSAGVVLAEVDIAEYHFFIIMNSSVRGPFLPSYFSHTAGGGLGVGSSLYAQSRPWTTAFTDLLNSYVKLAGTTINCEVHVHVQSMLLATDSVGLKILIDSGAFECARDRDAAIANYELGASARIMEKGYSVDCLMLRYAGVDWLSLKSPRCNQLLNPYVPLYNDGMSLNPLEVVFVKVKPHTLASDHTVQRWTDYVLGRDDLVSSFFYSSTVQRVVADRRKRLERMVRDCDASFDHASFLERHPELDPAAKSANYELFLDKYLFSGEPYRYTVPHTREEDVPHLYCRSFVKYGVPDFSDL